MLAGRSHRSQQIAAWGAIVLLAVQFIAFALYLDRYPPFYTDEAFYNYPAVSYLNNQGYVYRHSVDTPHGDSLWAYNGPFFSRLQTLTFRLFGNSLLNWRLPQFIRGFCAVGVLLFQLIVNRRALSALLLAAIWAGDRTLQELRYGRPDGIALLFLAIAFVLLVDPLHAESS